MVCGTSSDSGKSTLTTGLCRLLARRGVSVAPFKGQNMSLNAMVTAEGGEIGRAQWLQAAAAGAEPEVAMNPVLLKPTGEHASEVVVMGRPTGVVEAARFQQSKHALVGVVDAALASLRARFDVVVCEGAGSPAEINLLRHDLVNLGLARRSGIPAIVVGDIERGGVFAHLYGTVALLPDELSSQVQGFVINRFRGDRALLGGATAELEDRCGVPTLGVLPHLGGLDLDAEDSLALVRPSGPPPPAAAGLDVAAIRLPRLSNFTDLDPFSIEPGVRVRWVDHPGALGEPDLVVVGGTRATMADLRWLRDSGLVRALDALRSAASPPVFLGICGGFQMMGDIIDDPAGVESTERTCAGLGWLPVRTAIWPTRSLVLSSARAPTARGCAATRSAMGASSPASAACPGSPTTPRAMPWARWMRPAASSARRFTGSLRRTGSGPGSSALWRRVVGARGARPGSPTPRHASARSTESPTPAPNTSTPTGYGGWWRKGRSG